MYLSPFIPGLSTLTAPLHELLKKDTDFSWNCTGHAAFQQVKEAVISDTILKYFDPSLPITIQVNASPHPGPDIPLDIAIHHACLSPERKEAFQQAFVSDSQMSSWMTASYYVEKPVRKGEDTTATPPVPSRNHQSTVVHL